MRTRFWPVLALALPAAPAQAQDLSVQANAPIVSDVLIHSGNFEAGRSTVPAGHCPETGGTRRQTETVFFDPPYREPPQVLVSLNSFDFGIDGPTPRNPRINARAEQVSRIGMRLVVETWCDTNLIDAGGTYVVMGSRGVLAAIAPLTRPSRPQGPPSPLPPPRTDADVLDDW